MQFSDEQIKEAENMVSNGHSWNEIARIYGLTNSSQLKYWLYPEIRKKKIEQSRKRNQLIKQNGNSRT